MGNSGRPTKFNSALSAKIQELYESGKTDAEVAKIIGVSPRTIYYWKSSQPEFLQSLKEGKDIADELVVSSLFRRATGYTHPEEKIGFYEGYPIKVKTYKHYPPDVTAQIFWLKNRRPHEWRDREDPLPPPPPEVQKIPEKKTFDEFCVTAGYPKPYDKQHEMRAFGIAVDDPRLLLGSRGYGKTDYVTVLGVAYEVYSDWFDHYFYQGPAEKRPPLNETNVIISKSKTRNSAMIEEIANALEANGVSMSAQNKSHLDVSRYLTPEEEKAKLNSKKKGKDHSVEVLTIKSSFRGRHPKRIIMDDPVTEEDTSDAMRILVKKKYDEAYKLCKNIVIIGQPAHAFDLYAELRPQLKKLEVPWGSIPELDADLDAMKRAGIDSNSISMSYHLVVPMDGTMPFSKIKYIDAFPIGESVAFLDPSEGGDFTAVSALKGLMDGIAVEGKAWKKAWYHCIDELVPFLVAKKVTRLCFETNKFGLQPIAQLSQALAPYGIGVVGRHSHSDKHAAIMSAGSYSHMIHLSKESNKDYTDQVVKYEYSSKFDDAPDSLARGLEWIGLLMGKK